MNKWYVPKNDDIETATSAAKSKPLYSHMDGRYTKKKMLGLWDPK